MSLEIKALGELGKFLGKKFDEVVMAVRTSQQARIDIDIDESIDEIREVIKTSIKNAIDRLDIKLDLPDKSNELRAILTEITKGNSITPPEDKKTHSLLRNVFTDTSDLKRELKNIVKNLHKYDIPEVKTMERSLKMIHDSIESNKRATVENLIKLSETIRGIKLDIPAVFKLDKEQLRSIRSSSMTTTGGVLSARNVKMTNVSMSSANTQYSHTFTSNTTAFYAKLRSQSVKLLYAWETGKLPTSGDGSAYATTSQNFVNSRPGVDLSGLTIYVQSASTSQTLEIEEYYA